MDGDAGTDTGTTETDASPEGATDTVDNTAVDDSELTPEEQAMLAAQEAEAESEVIVVTGSAIERKELTTPAPVSVIDKADIQASGLASVGDVLQNLPSQSNAINIQANNGGDGSTRVDIRGLGAVRTLVLMNGRRVVASGTGADASVDLNSIPLAAIERVEVLKDGASAIYGSDALGGVVNIITRDDFDGEEANVYTGTTQRGDGQVYDVSFVTGVNGKKSNVVFSAGYTEQKAVWAGDRTYSTFDHSIDDWSTCPGPGSPGSDPHYAGYDPAMGKDCQKSNSGSYATPGGYLYTDGDFDGVEDPGNTKWQTDVLDKCPLDPTTGAGGECTRDPDGTWRPFVAPDDLYNFQPENYLYTPSQRYNVFSTGHYDVADHARVFYEGLYNHRFSRQQLASEPLVLDGSGPVISADNEFNEYGLDIPFFLRRLTEFGDRFFTQNVDTFRSVFGIDGDMPENSPLKTWKWEASFNYGKNVAQGTANGSLIVSHLAKAIGPSFQDANGQWHCGTSAADSDPACVPLNLLGGSGAISPDQVPYLTFTGVNSGYNDQKTVLAQAHGQLFKVGDGDVSAAFGADYRYESGAFVPDPLTSTGDTTGNAVEPTAGAYHVSEGFLEISAVPVVGKKALQWLELDGAARMFKYNTFNDPGLTDNLTYKGGALIRTVEGIAVRGTYSTAFRAPSISELYSGNADDFPQAHDPCDTTNGALSDIAMQKCADQGVPASFVSPFNQLRSKIGGNPNLGAETAKIFTTGLVYEPPQVKGLAVTLDYFNLVINNAVQSEGVPVILANCYQRGDDAECAKVHRVASTHQVDFIDDSLNNVGGNDTNGIDFQIALDREFGKAGRFRNSLEGTYLLAYHLETAQQNLLTGEHVKLNGRGVYDLGVYPYIKANWATQWARGPAGGGFNIRYIGGYSECENDDCDSTTFLDTNGDGMIDTETPGFHARRHVDYNVTADLFLSYAIKTAAGTTSGAIGVNNLTDQNPPYVDGGFLADSDSNTYDFLGRYFYLRLTQDF